uniref:Uncharacterized protein n=1 Tax=Macaca fascicularis TaxID=9541 RepID=A0A7N9IER0_MACFA
VCWIQKLGLLFINNYLQCLEECLATKSSCRVHVHNVQVCYICILVPCCCTAPINSSFTSAHSFTNS